GFADNQIDLLLKSRVERLGMAEHNEPETRAVGGGEVVAKIGKGLLKAEGSYLVRAESLEHGAALVEALGHHLEDTTNGGPYRGILGKLIVGGMKLHGRTEESLQKSVVEFPGDAHALPAALVETKIPFACGAIIATGATQPSANSCGQ